MKLSHNFKRRVVSALFSVFFFFGVNVASGQTTITVNTLEGNSTVNGNCSLHEAIFSAETNTAADACPAGSGDDVIQFSVTGTIVQTVALPSISSSVTIQGPGISDLTVDASAVTNVVLGFFGGTSIVSGITFSGGEGFNASSGAVVNFRKCVISGMASSSTGSAMSIYNSTVRFDRCTVTGNTSGTSGTLYGFGADLTITNSTFTNNSANVGGAVGTVGNSTTGPGVMVVNNSTFTGNEALGEGGAFWIAGDEMTASITSSTITGNTADSDADGSGNGGGVSSTSGAATTISNSIIAGNSDLGIFSEPNLSEGPFTSSGYNLIGDCTGACGDFASAGDQEGTSGSPIDPLLAALADNGGPTSTMALSTGSPAIDAGSCTGSDSDQRNFGDLSGGIRIVDVSGVTNADDGCDIGAYEVDGVTLPVELVSFDAIVDNGSVVLAWQTLSETNNAGFAVEMNDASSVGIDTWSQIAWIDGNATSSEVQDYSYRHSGLSPGVFLFRLKQIDFDGSFNYSNQVEITVAIVESHLISPAYPNPFSDQATFSLTTATDQEVQIAAFDLLGRKVDTLHSGPLTPGFVHTFALDGTNLTSGLYFIQVTGHSFSDVLRVTLRK